MTIFLIHKSKNIVLNYVLFEEKFYKPFAPIRIDTNFIHLACKSCEDNKRWFLATKLTDLNRIFDELSDTEDTIDLTEVSELLTFDESLKVVKPILKAEYGRSMLSEIDIDKINFLHQR